LAQAPKVVTIVFSEAPDPRLSSIQVLDSSGGTHQVGRTTPVPGQPNSLQVGVGRLSPGVYTVNWRTVSSVDGHLASGSFAFGFKVAPTGAATSAVVRAPPASTWAVAARWCFYVGLMGLVGAAEIGLLAGASRLIRWFATASVVFAVTGLVLLEEQQRRSDGIPFNSLWSSSLGHEVLGRAVPVAAAAAILIWVWARPRSRLALGLLGVAALAAMFGDVDASHVAGEHSWRWFHLATQWVHFAAAGVWLGGLAVVVAVILTLEADDRRRLSRRFSSVALGAVIVVGISGALRGLDEIRTWHGLFDTTFGRWALVKIILLVCLIGLGVVQRQRGVPLAGRGDGRFLRRVGGVELAVGAVVLVAAGFLQSLAPPSATAATPARSLVVSGHDFATTVNVRVRISPGTPGFNRFDLRAVDYDTLQPIPGAIVTLSFTLPDQPDLGSSTLNLAHQSNGDYVAVAPNLSVAGTWSVSVLVQHGTQSAEVPLTVTTSSPPVKIDVSRSPGLPTVYTIHAKPSASIQVYLDPGHPGFNEFHVTMLDPNDNEIPTSQLSVNVTRPGQAAASALTVRKLDNVGHYVADLPGATPGNYHFSIDATTNEGAVHASITIPVS
jgi:copper transport protein